MLAPAPPRCCTRSSTRKESETFSIWPSTNCSTNFPAKVIRWSVAMEPVTATGTEGSFEHWNGARCGAAHRNTLGVRARAHSVGQHPAPEEPQLEDADRPERSSHGRSRGYDRPGGVQPGQH